MTEEKKPLEIVFMPGCFDDFDGTQEELDEMIAQIHQMASTGELMEKSTPIDIEALADSLTDEEIEDLMSHLDDIGDIESIGNSTRNLQ